MIKAMKFCWVPSETYTILTNRQTGLSFLSFFFLFCAGDKGMFGARKKFVEFVEVVDNDFPDESMYYNQPSMFPHRSDKDVSVFFRLLRGEHQTMSGILTLF